MNGPTSVTEEQAIAWFDAFATARPRDTSEAGPVAHPVRSFRMMPATNGLAIRVMMESGGQADLFLNAIVVKALLDAITTAAAQGGWMNEAGDIVIRTPSGPLTFRPAT